MRVHFGNRGLGTSTPITVTPQLQTLAQAIQTQEGYYPGSVAYTNNNPGNLVYAGQAGATPGPNGFAVFPSYQDGLNALYNQLNLYATGTCGACGGQPLTIQQMANIYAPAGQGSNNPTVYANNMAAALGVSPDTLLSTALAGGSGNAVSDSMGTMAPANADNTGTDDGIFDSGDDAILGFDPTFFMVVAIGVVGTMWLWGRDS
jgi:hypothetical protein